MKEFQVKQPEIIEITFSEIPIGVKFKIGNILHKKVSATATYGTPIDKKKGEKGIYSFNPETKLTFNK